MKAAAGSTQPFAGTEARAFQKQKPAGFMLVRSSGFLTRVAIERFLIGGHLLDTITAYDPVVEMFNIVCIAAEDAGRFVFF